MFNKASAVAVISFWIFVLPPAFAVGDAVRPAPRLLP